MVGASVIRFDANTGSTVNISGGSVGNSFEAHSGSIVNISGGSVGNFFDANIRQYREYQRRKHVGVGLDVFSGSEINLFGTEFRLDGVLLEDLEFGQAFTVVDRECDLFGCIRG